MRLAGPGGALVPGDDADQMSWAFVPEPVDERAPGSSTGSRGTINRVVLGLMLKVFWHPLDFGLQQRHLLSLRRLVEAA